MPLLALLAFLSIGFLIGISGIGGFLVPPVLLMALDIDIRTAIVTALGSFIIISIHGFILYYKNGLVDFRYGGLLVAGALPGIAVGLTVNMNIPEFLLTAGLAFFLLLISMVSLLERWSGSPFHSSGGPGRRMAPFSGKRLILIPAGFAGGIMAGFVGVGGPVVTVPLMLYFGFQPKVSVGTSIFSGIFIVIFAFVFHLLYTPVEFSHVVLVGLTGAVGVSVGARLTKGAKQNSVSLIVTGITLLSAFYLFGRL